MYKKILHISWIRHKIIDDIYFYRKDKLFIKDEIYFWLENDIKTTNFEIILFHFIEKLDIDFILDFINKNKEKKIWLYFHTYFPFYEDWTALSWKITKNQKYLDFIEKLNFVIFQDNYSFNLIKSNFKINKSIILKTPIIEEEVISNKNFLNKFRLAFVWGFSYIKWFDFFKNFINKNKDFLKRNEIELNLFTLKNPWENIRINDLVSEKVQFDNILITINEYDRKSIYSNIDSLIIPSIWNETWPMVLYEAFTNNIPVILSNQESLKEKVIDRADSYIFKTWDERDLLKWILWMKKNYEKVILNKQWFRYNTIENFNKQLTNFLNEL